MGPAVGALERLRAGALRSCLWGGPAGSSARPLGRPGFVPAPVLRTLDPPAAPAGAAGVGTTQQVQMQSDSPTSASARLLIRAGARREEAGALHGLALRLRRCWRAVARRSPALPAAVRVVDLQGRSFSIGEGDRLPLELSLPAGTYHVTARRGPVQRRYTVTLERGTTVELRLRLGSDDA